MGNLSLAVPNDLEMSEINLRFNLNNERFTKDFSFWIEEMNQKDSPAHTLIPYSDGPISTSLKRPRRIGSSNGRVFISKVIQKDGSQAFEFISWNSLRKRNDFGIITNYGKGKNLKFALADRNQCLQCHKTGSAIFMKGPWITSTGANAVTASLQSFGILYRLKDTDLQPWKAVADFFSSHPKQMKTEYGDLPSEVTKKVKDIKLDGIRVFDFKGAEQLDENVVRNYLLTMTYEIHRKLGESERKQFAVGITEGALKAVLLPKEIEARWNWYPYLKPYLGSAASPGPLRANYFPPFENKEVVNQLKITVSSYHPESFQALLQADEWLDNSSIDMFPFKYIEFIRD
jgi:hypothetical protein